MQLQNVEYNEYDRLGKEETQKASLLWFWPTNCIHFASFQFAYLEIYIRDTS